MANKNDKAWDFQTKHVDPNIPEDKFVNAASILIAMGPPRFAWSATGSQTIDAQKARNMAYPVGCVDTLSLGQQRDVQRLFEIGSDLQYFIQGRTTASITMARTIFNGPNLLNVAYAYYKSNINFYRYFDTEYIPVIDSNVPDGIMHSIKIAPGYGNLWINLASDLFKRKTGILLLLHDEMDEPYAQVYLENCNIASHQLNITSGSTLIGEGVQILFDRIQPIKTEKSG